MKDDNKTNDWFVRSQAALIGDGNTVWVVLMILNYGGIVDWNRFWVWFPFWAPWVLVIFNCFVYGLVRVASDN